MTKGQLVFLIAEITIKNWLFEKRSVIILLKQEKETQKNQENEQSKQLAGQNESEKGMECCQMGNESTGFFVE